jgi:DNA-binding HxlR family transcriptional regulator
MGICIVILAGYERDRHLFGIKELSKHGIDCIYVLYDDVHPEFREIAEPNAIYIKDSASPFFKTYVRGCNPTSFESIIQELTYIYKKESSSEIFIDVTNFTKESYIAAFTFGILFGARLYYVLPEKHEPIDIRIGKVFSELRNDAEIISKFKEIVHIEDSLMQNYLNDFFHIIEKKYKEKVKDQYKFREPTSIQVIPLKIKGLVELTPEHEEILKILQEKGAVSSIAQLTKALKKSGKNAQAMVGYRLRQMRDWGFIEITGQRKKEISLTELGRGYANGLLALKGKNS